MKENPETLGALYIYIYSDIFTKKKKYIYSIIKNYARKKISKISKYKTSINQSL